EHTTSLVPSTPVHRWSETDLHDESSSSLSSLPLESPSPPLSHGGIFFGPLGFFLPFLTGASFSSGSGSLTTSGSASFTASGTSKSCASGASALAAVSVTVPLLLLSS